MDDAGRVGDDGIRPLVRGALWCAGGVLVVAAALYAVFWLPYRDPADEPPYPLPILPAAPRQEQPAAGVAPPGYEWVDRDAGIVRIPVEDAMAVTAERLPVRREAAPDRRPREEPPTDAGSGRSPPPGGDR